MIFSFIIHGVMFPHLGELTDRGLSVDLEVNQNLWKSRGSEVGNNDGR